MSTPTTLRFAPSPTGFLHVGNARMALVNWLFARHARQTTGAGRFILRLDDTDQERSKPEFADAIEADLAWMGLEWDVLERQSARMARYEEAFESLKASGRVYACYETPEELEYMRRRLRSRGKPPIYDQSMSPVGDAERADRDPHWRFKLSEGEIAFDDMVRGAVRFDAKNLSDPVIVRADGTFLYMLPSAIDDADMGVTHVMRGEDHVTNTAVQLQMFDALGAAKPTFAHLPLLTDMEGGGLSKRLGSLMVSGLRDDGISATALNAYLANLGTGLEMPAEMDLESLATAFSMADFGRGTPKFDQGQLNAVNARLLHETDFATVSDKLTAMGLEVATADWWDAVRGNLESLDDAKIWYDVCFGTVSPQIDDADFMAKALDVLPAEPWDEGTWKTWTGAVKEATGAKGKGLFMPLRQALTANDHGPELKLLLPIMGRDKVSRRLAGEAA